MYLGVVEAVLCDRARFIPFWNKVYYFKHILKTNFSRYTGHIIHSHEFRYRRKEEVADRSALAFRDL